MENRLPMTRAFRGHATFCDLHPLPVKRPVGCDRDRDSNRRERYSRSQRADQLFSHVEVSDLISNGLSSSDETMQPAAQTALTGGRSITHNRYIARRTEMLLTSRTLQRRDSAVAFTLCLM